MFMKIRIGLALLLFAIITAQAQQAPQSFTPAKSAEDAGFSTERLQRLDAIMQSFITEGLAPNATVFVARNGKVASYKAYGYSNLETKTPLKKDDLFRIASQ